MTKFTFLLFAVLLYVAAIVAVGLTYKLATTSIEFTSYSASTPVTGGETGLSGGALGMGLIAAALILSGSFFLYKAFQKEPVR